MKKLLLLSLLTLSVLPIASCNKENNDGSTLIKKSIYTSNENKEAMKLIDINLLFKKDNDVPYISFDEGFNFLSQIRHLLKDEKASSDSIYYKVTNENDKIIVKNEVGATCTINPNDQTLVFNDFDLFTSMNKKNFEPLSLIEIQNETYSLKQTSSKYTNNQGLTVDLKPYTDLDIYKSGDKYYLPLSVFNSIFVDSHAPASLLYNFKDLFYVPQNTLTESVLGLETKTNFGKKFYDVEQKETFSDSYTKYNYQSICLNLDYTYGLKNAKNISSFDKFFESKGFKEDMLSGNIYKMDLALSYALSYLNDNHTLMNKLSIFADEGKFDIDKTKFSKESTDFDDGDTKLKEDAKNAGIQYGYEIIDDTMFIAFRGFNEINEKTLYASSWGEIDSNDTAVLFANAYKELTTGKYKDKIKTIVVDLTTNDGGASDSLTYGLATLIGEVYYDLSNPITNSYNHQTYRADLNLDKVIDDKDKSLLELGFNIVFIDSEYSFSSANEMPSVAKINKPQVLTIGQKTAGGPCVSKTNYSPTCSKYLTSGISCFNKVVDGIFVDLDGGVNADHNINKADLFKRQDIVNSLKEWLKK